MNEDLRTSSSSPLTIAIVGPTATGKTDLGVQLAQALSTEVISADSQLVYRGLDIGVAKPSMAERCGVPHHMIDVIDPTQQYSAGTYATEARPYLESLWASGKTPILVGGTGFYIKALLQPDHVPAVPTNEPLRAYYHDVVQTHGSAQLHAWLQDKDPIRAQALHPHDTPRLIRALEIIEATGQPVPPTPQTLDESVILIGLTYDDRPAHVHRIEERLNQMMAAGFLEETQQLYQHYGWCPGLTHAHGYPELIAVLEGQRPLDDALKQIAINIRQYSKRQMTWFRRWPQIHWITVDTVSKAEQLDQTLNFIKQMADPANYMSL